MAVSTNSVDLADVAALAELEKSARSFQAALDAAGEAYERLRAAKYPGIEHILGWESTPEELSCLVEGLEDLRLANGDRGAADYFFFFKRMEVSKSIEDAAKELLDTFNDVSRVDPMRRYAESMA